MQLNLYTENVNDCTLKNNNEKNQRKKIKPDKKIINQLYVGFLFVMRRWISYKYMNKEVYIKFNSHLLYYLTQAYRSQIVYTPTNPYPTLALSLN